MNNETISVPRADLVRLQEDIDPHRNAVAWGLVCDLLAQPAEQHQGEPVAWVLVRDGEVCYEADDGIVISNVRGDETDLYTWEPVWFGKPAPVAVVLPTKEDFKTWADRRAYDLSHSDKGIFHNIDTREAWSCFKAGADAAARLNPPQR